MNKGINIAKLKKEYIYTSTNSLLEIASWVYFVTNLMKTIGFLKKWSTNSVEIYTYTSMLEYYTLSCELRQQ